MHHTAGTFYSNEHLVLIAGAGQHRGDLVAKMIDFRRLQIAIEIQHVNAPSVVGNAFPLIGLFTRAIFLFDRFFECGVRQKCLSHHAAHVFQTVVEFTNVEVTTLRETPTQAHRHAHADHRNYTDGDGRGFCEEFEVVVEVFHARPGAEKGAYSTSSVPRASRREPRLDALHGGVSHACPMNIEDLANELQARFRSEAAVGIDMLVRLDVSPGEHLLLRVADGSLTVTQDTQTPDVTFRFADLPTAIALIRGQANAIDAFMHGRFRSDGYLMMAFRLMELFGSRSLPPTPND